MFGAAETFVVVHENTHDGTDELLPPVDEFSSPQRIYLHIL